MSRGPGRIERAIRELFDASPYLAFITDELCEHCYPEAQPIERKHQVAVLRAACNVVKNDPDWQVWRINGMGGGYVFVNHANVESYTLGYMIAGQGSRIIYRSDKRARRRPFKWVSAGYGFHRKLPVPSERQYIADRAQLLALDPGSSRSIAQDHVADHIAWRDGDAEARAVLEARWTAEREASLEYGRRLAARIMGWELDDDKCYEPDGAIERETLRALEYQTLGVLATRLRALTAQNDPDALRTGLLEIADLLEKLAVPWPTNNRIFNPDMIIRRPS